MIYFNSLERRNRVGGGERDRGDLGDGAEKPWRYHFLDFSAEQPWVVLLRESVLPTLGPRC